jgi:hypothetical protein
MHQTVAAAFCYLVTQVWQTGIRTEPLNQSGLSIPARPHFSQSGRKNNHVVGVDLGERFLIIDCAGPRPPLRGVHE